MIWGWPCHWDSSTVWLENFSKRGSFGEEAAAMTHFLRSMWSRLWIWFGEIGWTHLFSFPPPTPKKKWVEVPSSENHWGSFFPRISRLPLWKNKHQWAEEKVRGNKVPREAGGTGGTGLKGKKIESCCFDLKLKKLFCQKEESFLQLEHSREVTNPSAPWLKRYARWADSYHPGGKEKKTKKKTSPWVVWVIALPLHCLQAVCSHWPLTSPWQQQGLNSTVFSNSVPNWMEFGDEVMYSSASSHDLEWRRVV